MQPSLPVASDARPPVPQEEKRSASPLDSHESVAGDGGSDGLTDAALVRRAQVGDLLALEALFSRRWPAFRRHAEKACGNPTDAQDICVAACRKAVANITQLRNPEAFCGWVGQIITHEAYRWRKNLQPVGTSLEELASTEIETMSVEPANYWPADFKYLRELLGRQASRVEQPCRRTALFMLDYFGQEQEFPTVRAIAEATQTSHGTAQRCRDIILVAWRRTLTAFDILP